MSHDAWGMGRDIYLPRQKLVQIDAPFTLIAIKLSLFQK